MKNILVVGDWITDRYHMHTAERLCPEAPVPVLKKNKQYDNPGGAGLVAAQLAEFPDIQTFGVYGSKSLKERIYADDHLFVRIDNDSYEVKPQQQYVQDIITTINTMKTVDAVIVSDYGKGAMTPDVINLVMQTKARIFVDAKNNWSAYRGAFAAFPNKKEAASSDYIPERFDNSIVKLGSQGSSVNEALVPGPSVSVRDTCGAGDVFIASFVYWFLTCAWSKDLIIAADFANQMAALSVQHVGTHAVTSEERDADLICDCEL